MMLNGFWKETWSAEIVNHLWQSTMVILVAWLLTLVLTRNRARTRYWVWMVASLKLLIPFSLLAAIGDWLRPASGIPLLEGPHLTSTMVKLANPFLQGSQSPSSSALVLPLTASVAPSPYHVGLPEIAVTLWLCGLVFLLLR